jgi:hypothetical protein
MLEHIKEYAEQLAIYVPDERLRRVLARALAGIVTQRSPVIARMASLPITCSSDPEAAAKQLRRFFDNTRVRTLDLWRGLYHQTRAQVDQQPMPVVPVVIDGVNLEKPYARKLPGLSTVHKQGVANRHSDRALTSGYPVLAVAALVGTCPALTFAHLFSYIDDAFVSVKRQMRRAILTTTAVLWGYTVRFIGDREFDDDQVMSWMAQYRNQFLVRAFRRRTIEVWDDATTTWRRSSMQECAETLPLPAVFHATFTHSRKHRDATIRLGYCRIHLPTANNLECWLIVGHASIFRKPLWLLTNAPITDLDAAIALWWQFRTRPHIEHLFRLLQERGLDIEDIRLRTQERSEKLIAVVWAAAQFLWHLSLTLSASVQAWLRRLGGRPSAKSASDGLYLLLYGLSTLLLAYCVTLLETDAKTGTHDAYP